VAFLPALEHCWNRLRATTALSGNARKLRALLSKLPAAIFTMRRLDRHSVIRYDIIEPRKDERPLKSRNHRSVEALVMQYRIGRAARRMGYAALLILSLCLIASIMSLFAPKIL
jgi:hypothetical protein